MKIAKNGSLWILTYFCFHFLRSSVVRTAPDVASTMFKILNGPVSRHAFTSRLHPLRAPSPPMLGDDKRRFIGTRGIYPVLMFNVQWSATGGIKFISDSQQRCRDFSRQIIAPNKPYKTANSVLLKDVSSNKRESLLLITFFWSLYVWKELKPHLYLGKEWESVSSWRKAAFFLYILHHGW